DHLGVLQRPIRQAACQPLDDLPRRAREVGRLEAELGRVEARATRATLRGRHAVVVLAVGGAGAGVIVVALDRGTGDLRPAPVVFAAIAVGARVRAVAVAFGAHARPVLAHLAVVAVGVVAVL